MDSVDFSASRRRVLSCLSAMLAVRREALHLDRELKFSERRVTKTSRKHHRYLMTDSECADILSADY